MSQAKPAARHDAIIDVGRRRWRSFDRRNRRKHPTHEDRIEDLARGLWQAFETSGLNPGPEMQDYRCVARVMAEVLSVGEPASPAERT